MKLVLVVDDEYAIADLLAELLGDEGYRVITASDGAHALRAVANETPDCALIDLMMPRMNGIELIKAMQADPRLAEVPVILMSAAMRSHYLAELGISGVLQKPFTLPELLSLIDKITANR